MDETSLHLRLYGTEEKPAATRTIIIGQLSVVLHSGALRQISIGGVEAIRGIAFVVRDENWGTYRPEISGLEVVENDDGVRISYSAECRDKKQTLGYDVVIEGSTDGSLEFVVTGAARSDFLTSRAGFVVLHPIEGVAGHPVIVTHTDGSTELSRFPGLISPSQPFFDIRALSHQVAPGLSVTCTMEGDTFEMEDQRNWTDASFKTYIRPLSKPHPYVLEKDKRIVQRVGLSIEGTMPADYRRAASADRTVSIREGIIGRVPKFALAVHPDHAEAAQGVADAVRRSHVGYLVCTFDASAGHGVEAMAQFKLISELTGAGLILEAVLPLRDDRGQFTDDLGVLETDIATIKRCADKAGAEFDVISASPACFCKSYQPIDNWPGAPTLEAVYAQVRRAFPKARIAGGMHSYFTELNRCPSPIEGVDIITHTTCPIVHAADDVSVMESLQALPWVFASVRDLTKGTPYWIGPTAIGMRMNPYGVGPMQNPGNVRRAMAETDPRQRGLFNAAWTLGYVSRAVAGGVEGLCLSSIAGPSAIIWQKMNWAQPWFDEQLSEIAVFPVYHVITGLASRTGAGVRSLDCSDPTTIAALALDTGAGQELWLANLTPERCRVSLQGIEAESNIERLDAETFELCCSGPEGFSSTKTPMGSRVLDLGAFAVIRIT